MRRSRYGDLWDRAMNKGGQVTQSELNEAARQKFVHFEGGLARRYFSRMAQFLRLGDLGRQRLKLFIYFAWGYWPLARISVIPLRDRLKLLWGFLRIDWHVLHGHLPSEISHIAKVLATRPAQTGEAMVEAGCWNGGSSAKFSLLCARFGLQLHIYDSFEGVEELSAEDQAKEWRYSGQYAAGEQVLRSNLERFGRSEVCTIHKGWFADTLANCPATYPIRLVYIDCDLAKGTREVLTGVLAAMVGDGCIFTQDFHIAPVRQTLLDSGTWEQLGMVEPRIEALGVRLARLSWHS